MKTYKITQKGKWVRAVVFETVVGTLMLIAYLHIIRYQGGGNLVRSKKAIPQVVRRTVIIRDRGICQYCGKQGDYRIFSETGWVWMEHELDHLIPESKGGQAIIENIVVACRHCNRSKGNKSLIEWGWLNNLDFIRR